MSIKDSKKLLTITPYPFLWETADLIPMPVGYSNVPVPWGGGVNRRFSDDILTDYKSSDGWVLLYNMFNIETFPMPGYFMLYNRYRGLLRIYLYLPSSTPVPSNYVTYKFGLGGTNPNTSILNFAGNDIVDVNVNLKNTLQAQPYQLVSTGSWYSSQFELAYDPNISTLRSNEVNFLWELNSTNITQLSLSGSLSGTLDSIVQTPTNDFSLGGALLQGAFYATGAAILSKHKDLFPKLIQGAISGAIESGLQGVVKNVFSAIFGGNSTNAEEIHLNINTKISLKGNATNNSQIFANSIFIPSTVGNQTAQGFSPGYNYPLGVFNLGNRPKVTKTTTRTQADQGLGYGFYYQYDNLYTIVESSINLKFNPVVINSSPTGATIQDIKKEVVLLPIKPTSTDLTYVGGNLEQIGEYLAYSSEDSLNNTYVVPKVNPQDRVVVRISFFVVPNNGAPKVLLVKSFTSDIV